MVVKLAGRQVPETLSAIDTLWKHVGEPRPIVRVFVDQAVQEVYQDDIRQGQMFAAFAGIALLIACLGLFGLAVFTAERRTKEIGVRKAMGASRWQIVRMLLWELTRPVLVANLVAWPLSLYLMSRWLAAFAYHIELQWWMFLASGLLALLIAWVTVSTHAFLVARVRPATALRYE
jgi:putative ABC transport system permease protein